MIPNCMQSLCQCLPNGSFHNEVFDFLGFLRRAGFKSTGIMEHKTRIGGKSDLISNVLDATLDDPSNRSCNMVQCLLTHRSCGIYARLAGINLIELLAMYRSWDGTHNWHCNIPRFRASHEWLDFHLFRTFSSGQSSFQHWLDPKWVSWIEETSS